MECTTDIGPDPMTMDRVIMAPREIAQDKLAKLRKAFAKLNKDKTFKNMMNRLGENTEYIDGPE